jgi:hypothetical protein
MGRALTPGRSYSLEWVCLGQRPQGATYQCQRWTWEGIARSRTDFGSRFLGEASLCRTWQEKRRCTMRLDLEGTREHTQD